MENEAKLGMQILISRKNAKKNNFKATWEINITKNHSIYLKEGQKTKKSKESKSRWDK